MSILSLFHGTIYDFSIIDLSVCRINTDFGRGFYLTEDKAQAVDFASKLRDRENGRRFKRKKKLLNTAYVYEFQFDINLVQRLNVKVFSRVDKEWLKFIVLNRESNMMMHNYDIVIGPTADARAQSIIADYRYKLKETNFSDDICKEVISKLRVHKLTTQYCFCTYEAIQYLQFIWRRIV